MRARPHSAPRAATCGPQPALSQLAWAVNASTRVIPRSTCLVRALAARRLLARHGYASTLRIGVARAPESIDAHAWLECNGAILIGAPVPGRYTLLPNPQAHASPGLASRPVQSGPGRLTATEPPRSNSMASPFQAQPHSTLGLSADHCPDDVSSVADLYCLNRLSSEQAQVFEDHYLQCPDCAAQVELAQNFIDGLRDATERT